jgi:DNA-binding MarR family transcriptional regulator
MTEEERFAAVLSRVAREITRRQASEVCCGDLTLEQFQTLQALSRSEPSSMGALSTALRVDLSTMSRNVTVLERNGHLARARSADDGRVVEVRLTSKGRRALETLRCGERDVLGDVYGRLAPVERAKVVKALATIEACLAPCDVAPGDGDGPCCPPRTKRAGAS